MPALCPLPAQQLILPATLRSLHATLTLNCLLFSWHTMAFHTSLRLYAPFLPSGMLFGCVSLEAFLLFRCHIFWIDSLAITNGNFVRSTSTPSNGPRFTSTQPQRCLFLLISPREDVRSKPGVPSAGVWGDRGVARAVPLFVKSQFLLPQGCSVRAA